MVWDDRLAEVWAEPSKAGAGVLVGAAAVLIVRHVVAGVLDHGRVLARVVTYTQGTGPPTGCR